MKARRVLFLSARHGGPVWEARTEFGLIKVDKRQLANRIWESANKLRSKIEANEYKDFILGFIFYKFLSDREEQYARSELKCSDEDAHDVFEHVRALGVSDMQEHFFALYLDPKKRLLCSPKVVTTGLVNASLLHARELFREAIHWGATSLYVAHNHPSGDATPSKEDMEITITLLEASKILGIPMRDHIVIGTENSPGPAFVSIRERMEKQ